MTILSATGIAAYQTCALKYKFSRVDRWVYDGPVRPGNMELGTLVHHLVELRINGASIESMPSAVDNWIEQAYEDDYSKASAHKDHKGYALAMSNYVISWMDHTKFWEKWDFVSSEQQFSFTLGGHQFRFQCDLVVKHKVTGNYGIIDYKTAGTLQNTLHARDWQMNVMAVGLETLGYPVYYGAHLKVKRVKTAAAKPPYCELHEIRFSPQRLELTKSQLTTLASRIKADPLYLPSPSHNCQSMCAYMGACEAMGSGSDWEYVMMQTHKRSEQGEQ